MSLLKLFKPRGRPSVISTSDANEVVKRVNALSLVRVVRGSADRFLVGAGGSVLELKRDGIGGTETSPGGKRIQIVSVQSDYITGIDEASETTRVAKHPRLRGSLATEVIAGVTYSYTYSGTGYDSRTVSWAGGNSESQVVHPTYEVGDYIWADSVDACGVQFESVDLQLIEHGAREWARIPGDKIVAGTVDLTSGDTSAVVTYDELPSTPQQLFAVVHGAPVIAYQATETSPTTTGFTVYFSAAVPTGCTLDYVLIL